VCTEEMCFFNAGSSSFFGLGKAFPILRGGTLDQRATAFLVSRLDAREWVHVFPEARVWQEFGTPPRDEQGRWCSPTNRCSAPGSKVGPFKWGVGKLVANAEVTPVVVPIFHLGMQELLPQTEENEVISWVPRVGGNVTVVVGDPVPVQDLVDNYHRAAAERARLRAERRDAPRPADAPEGGGGGWWGRAVAVSPAANNDNNNDNENNGNDSTPSTPSTAAAGLFQKAKEAVTRAEKEAEEGAEKLKMKAKEVVSRAEKEAEEGAEKIKARVARFRESFRARMDAMTHYYAEPATRTQEDAHGRALIPTKTLSDGTVVPLFRDAPLRARPPDHDLLSDAEAREEHRLRLDLYRDITERIEAATRALEHTARERRRAKGYAKIDDRQG
jgi:Acyltransferase